MIAVILPPHDKRLYGWPTSLATSLYLSLFILAVSLCQVVFPGFSTQDRRLCLRENLPFISEDKKRKGGFNGMYLFSPFCLHSIHIFVACSIVQLRPPCRQPVLGVRGLSAQLDKCTGRWVIGDTSMEDKFSRLSLKSCVHMNCAGT